VSLIWYLAQPLLIAVLFGVWVYCLADALRTHRSWWWVLFLTFIPVVSSPVYLLNFKMGPGTHRGWLDAALADSRELRQLLSDGPDGHLPSVNLRIAEVHRRRGDHVQALERLKRLLDDDPEDLRAQFMAGSSFLAIGEPRRALPHLEYVVEEDSRYAGGEARLLLGRAHEEIGDAGLAFSQYERAARESRHPEAMVRYALALSEGGDPSEADRELALAIDLIRSMPAGQRAPFRSWARVAARERKRLRSMPND